MTLYWAQIRSWLLLAVIGFLLLGSESAHSQEWLLDHGRLGPIKNGMTPSEIERITKQKLDHDGCTAVLPKTKGVVLYFNFSGGRDVLRGIIIHSSKYRTKSGLRVGSRFSEIEHAYGKAQPFGDSPYGKRVFITVDSYQEGNYIINVAPPAHDSKNEALLMQFEIGKLNAKSHVKTMSVGWILGTEYCG